jgi:EmrB/QacA subfamily drug resistance transporter
MAPKTPPNTALDGAPSRHPDAILWIVLAAYLMFVLDVSVVVTALPEIRRTLDFSTASLSWVQNAYALAFGGLLLLGARAGDILGRRGVFMAGVAIFTVASLAAGLAQSSGWLLTARAAQGVGAAIAAPSVLALLQTTFPEGPQRARAIGLYSAVAGAGGVLGLILSGVITDLASWRWSLLINVPIGTVLVALVPRYLPETPRHRGHFDLPGALAVTIGMTALVYGFVRAAEDGWGTTGTLASLAVGVALLGAFVAIEREAVQPIVPLRLFASRQRSGAYLSRIAMLGGLMTTFFVFTQYLQGVRDLSPLMTGVVFCAMSAPQFVAVRNVARLIATYSERAVLLGGLTIAVIGVAWLSRATETTAYFPGILVPLALFGIGTGVAFVPLTTAGIAGVDAQDAGAASGLVNTAHQLGGSLGLAVLTTIFTAAERHAAEQPINGLTRQAQAAHGLTHAVSSTIVGCAAFLLVALGVAAIATRPGAVRYRHGQAEQAGAAS